MNLDRIALGTVQFGTNYGVANASGQVSIPEVQKILNFAKKNRIRTLDRVCERFGLSKAYIKNKYCYILDGYKTNLGSKVVPYYKDEMLYGENTHHYTYEGLSKSEKELYND